jgi:hypothetical protein
VKRSGGKSEHQARADDYSSLSLLFSDYFFCGGGRYLHSSPAIWWRSDGWVFFRGGVENNGMCTDNVAAYELVMMKFMNGRGGAGALAGCVAACA